MQKQLQYRYYLTKAPTLTKHSTVKITDKIINTNWKNNYFLTSFLHLLFNKDISCK